MEIDQTAPGFLSALRDFRRARHQAVLESIFAHLTGKSVDLLSYEEVREKLRAGGEPVKRGLQEIPLEAIVGSVGRYTDFTRTFLPRRDSDQRRWAEVRAVMSDLDEFPPIVVYQIGQVYFVLDGNHRVSVARQLGATRIKAYVTEVKTPVPLPPGVEPDELICSAKYAQFLERTGLDELRPEADLTVTAPGQYKLLLEQIEIHRHWLNEPEEREIPYDEAVGRWYDEVYTPVIQIIRERGILRDFPGRTETDLYVWVSRHQEELKEELGWEVGPESVASNLVARFSPKLEHVVARTKEKLLDAITPDPLEPGPPPGQWRQEQLARHRADRLFADILVPISGRETGWQALNQAFAVARREQARLHGLYVTPSENQKTTEQALALRNEFKQRCEVAKIPGDFTFEAGKVTRKICEHARWADLVVISLLHPPGPEPGARLSSGFGTLIRRCGRPVLAVTGNWSPLDQALLAYDGSPKANEALFVATYLSTRWQMPLVVVTVLEKGRTSLDTVATARKYLDARQVQATFVTEQGPVAEAIPKAAEAHRSNLIIMGGYGFNPLLEVVLGSTVDEVLRSRRWPVLICR